VALQRSNEDLSRFAFVASHDLQEPLRMIVSFAQLIMKKSADRLDQQSADHLERIVDAGHRMSRLIRDLLDYAQASSKGIQSPVQFPLAHAIPIALDNLRSAIEESGAHIVISDLPVVCAIEPQIAQVFQNLLSNAIKYRRPGVPLEVQISASREGSCWRITVQDNGEGFNPEHTSRIFDFLKRLHGQDVPGSGIGLALCKTIIERNGGAIGANGVPGEGATFWFTLPASCGQ